MNENGGKSSTILLTVIGIATLLVVVVGATFAYFAAQVSGNTAATSVTITAANDGSRVEEITGTDLTFVDNMYPDNDKVWAYQDVTLTISSANADAQGQTKYTFTLTGNNGFGKVMIGEEEKDLSENVVVQLVKADVSEADGNALLTVKNGYEVKTTLPTGDAIIAEATVNNNTNYTFKFRINLYYLNADYNQNTNENYTASFRVSYKSEGL